MIDDVSTDPNDQEQALFEYLKASGHGIKTLNDFDDLKEIKGDHLFMYEVPYDIVKFGFAAGATAFKDLVENVPRSSFESLVFCFSGFADSSRPLFMEKKVVNFVRGFLFGSLKRPSISNAVVALNLLFNENVFAFPKGLKSMSFCGDAYEVAGGIWAVAHAFPREIFVGDKTSPSGYSRDIDLNVDLYNLLLSERVEDDVVGVLLSRGMFVGGS
jgi:hypothetical protein